MRGRSVVPRAPAKAVSGGWESGCRASAGGYETVGGRSGAVESPPSLSSASQASPHQGSIRMAAHHRTRRGYTPDQSDPRRKSRIYKREDHVGPSLVHQLLGPRRPLPSPSVKQKPQAWPSLCDPPPPLQVLSDNPLPPIVLIPTPPVQAHTASQDNNGQTGSPCPDKRVPVPKKCMSPEACVT